MPASPTEKHAGAAPPQQGITQYCSALHVVLPQVVGPLPPFVTVLPPVAVLPPAFVDPPMLLAPAFELPPVPKWASLSVPLHAANTKTRSTDAAARGTIAKCMAPTVQPTCRSAILGFPRYSGVRVPTAVPKCLALNDLRGLTTATPGSRTYSRRPTSRAYRDLHSRNTEPHDGYQSCIGRARIEAHTEFTVNRLLPRFPVAPAHPERICWGGEKLCRTDELTCGSGSERIVQ